MASYVGAIASIISALIGAAITYFFAIKRQKLGVWIAPTENLTRSLQQHHKQITVSVGGHPFLDLNRSVVSVRNIGNTSIGNFAFDVTINGNHDGVLCDISAANPTLQQAITVGGEQPMSSLNPVIHVEVNTYLNAGETFKIPIFFDGAVDECTVRCRLENVKVKIRAGEREGGLLGAAHEFSTLNWFSVYLAMFSILIALLTSVISFTMFHLSHSDLHP